MINRLVLTPLLVAMTIAGPRSVTAQQKSASAAGLRDALVADAFSTVKYDAQQPADILAEDKVIGARKLGIPAEKVRITPVEEVFAK